MYFLLNNVGSFLIIFIQLPLLTQSVQCIKNYVINLPIDTTINFFNHSSTNETFCHVELMFNFNQNNVSIHFHSSIQLTDIGNPIYDHSKNNHLLIENFTLTLTDIITTVKYLCKTDNCDQKFVRETLTKSMAQFKTADLQKFLFDSYYTSTPSSTGVSCAGRICKQNQFCNAGIAHQISNIEEYLFTTIHRKCINKTDAEHSLISFHQIWTENKIHNDLRILCNRLYCDRKKTLFKTLTCFIRQFQLPLNKTFVSTFNETRMIVPVWNGIHAECTAPINTAMNRYIKRSDATNLSAVKFYFILSMFIFRM